MLAIRLPPEIEARLESLAKATGRTKSYYVREALTEHLADMEDLYLAETRLRRIRAGRVRPSPLGKVMKRHWHGELSSIRRRSVNSLGSTRRPRAGF